jgi:hypothetical protein
MATIEAKYHTLARGALRKKDLKQTRTYIARLENLNAGHFALVELRSAANNLEQSQKPAAIAPPPPQQISVYKEPPAAQFASAEPMLQAPVVTRQYTGKTGAVTLPPAAVQAPSVADTQLAQIKREMARRDCLYKADTNRLQCERDNNKDHYECVEQRRSEAKYKYETALSSYMLKNKQYTQCERQYWIEDKQRKAEEEEERNNRMMDHQTLVSILPPRRYHSVAEKCGARPQEPNADAFLDLSSCKSARDCDSEFQQQRAMCDLF